MELNYNTLLSLVSLLITFATILSHYWQMKIRLNDLEHRIRNLENKSDNFSSINEKIIKIEIILQHLQEKLDKRI